MTTDTENNIEEILALLEQNDELALKVYQFLSKKFVTRDEWNQAFVRLDRIEAALDELVQVAKEHTRQIQELRRTVEANTQQLQEHTRQIQELRRTVEANTQQLQEHTRQIQELRRTVEANTQQLQEHTRQILGLEQKIIRLDQKIDKKTDEILKYMDKKFSEYLGGTYAKFLAFSQDLIKKRVKQLSGKDVYLETHKHFEDPNKTVHPDSTDVEIDFFSKNPLVIAEATGELKDLDKVTRFINKCRFIEEMFHSTAIKLFIAMHVEPQVKQDAMNLLKKNGIEWYFNT